MPPTKTALVISLLLPALLALGQPSSRSLPAQTNQPPAPTNQSPTPAPTIPIRTITAGVTLKNLGDTVTLLDAIRFLKTAETTFRANGYTVQTLRIATNNFAVFTAGRPYATTLPYLIKMDSIVRKNNIILSIGQVVLGDANPAGIAEWAVDVIRSTTNINFSVPISSHPLGIHKNSIKAAAAIIVAISKNSEGGEGNFRFTAAANCPAGIPFFPAAWHEGPRSFAIGLESPKILTEVFSHPNKENARRDLTAALEKALLPIQQIAEKISEASLASPTTRDRANGVTTPIASPATHQATTTSPATHEATSDANPALPGKWIYDGIDDSPAPGLDASIGQAIETYTGQPFGSPSTLSACALITDVLKGLSIKKCGYSGLMLPVIEDKVLAQRAAEGRYTVQELLLFSSVSGTGLDVVPLPGDTPAENIENILTDIAALSLKYTAKALSGRLFLIPGRAAGDSIQFKNPHLTASTVMKIE